MLTLLALYPVVFLFGYFVQDPILSGRLGWPFFLALFAGNVASVVILNWVAPWVSGRFNWWTQPAGSETRQRTCSVSPSCSGLRVAPADLLAVPVRFLVVPVT